MQQLKTTMLLFFQFPMASPKDNGPKIMKIKLHTLIKFSLSNLFIYIVCYNKEQKIKVVKYNNIYILLHPGHA